MTTKNALAIYPMAQLSTAEQTAIVHAGIGGGDEAPHLPMLSAGDAIKVIAADTCLCRHFDGEGGLSEMFRTGLVNEEAPESEWRMVRITKPDGSEVTIPAAVDPHRALIYLRTIANNHDEEWQDVVLAEVGDLLAFVIASYYNDDFEELDGEDWDEFRNSFPEDVWETARVIASDHEPDALEADIFVAHAETLRKLFALPEDAVAKVEGSAGDILAELLKKNATELKIVYTDK